MEVYSRFPLFQGNHGGNFVLGSEGEVSCHLGFVMNPNTTLTSKSTRVVCHMDPVSLEAGWVTAEDGLVVPACQKGCHSEDDCPGDSSCFRSQLASKITIFFAFDFCFSPNIFKNFRNVKVVKVRQWSPFQVNEKGMTYCMQ